MLEAARPARRARGALPAVAQRDDLCRGYHATRATPDEIGWIAGLEADIYSLADAVPSAVLRAWYGANPSGFFVVRTANGAKVGHIDLLPLRPGTLAGFVDGTLVERDIGGEALYTPAERDAIRDLYVESIVVQPPQGASSAPAVRCVLRDFERLVAQVADPTRIRRVYAVAASGSGERLLRRLGFAVLRPAAHRQDQHDLFAADYPALREHLRAMAGTRVPDRDAE